MGATNIKPGTRVVVSTDRTKRGVFFGEFVEAKPSEDGKSWEVTLRQARMCICWSAETKGFGGLSSIGPQSGSRVGPPSPEMHLLGVECVAVASEEAAKAWEASPWN